MSETRKQFKASMSRVAFQAECAHIGHINVFTDQERARLGAIAEAVCSELMRELVRAHADEAHPLWGQRQLRAFAAERGIDLREPLMTTTTTPDPLRDEIRTITYRNTSDMLDNPDDLGIYPTTTFYDAMERDILALIEREAKRLTETQP